VVATAEDLVNKVEELDTTLQGTHEEKKEVCIGSSGSSSSGSGSSGSSSSTSSGSVSGSISGYRVSQSKEDRK